VKALTGWLTGSVAALAVGLVVATTGTTVGRDGSATGAPAAAEPGRDHAQLSQKTGEIRPNQHRLERPTRSRRAPTASPTPGGHAETRISAYLTGYSYWDNTPPGSSEISHPRVHEVAAGAGTYADPITVAVGHDLSSGSDVLDWPAGTRFYLPYLKRYVIVEDTCGDGSSPENGPCHTGYPSPALTWLDIWVGGQNADRTASDRCMSAITGVHTAIKDPGPDRPVSSGELTDDCTTYPQ
jgi:hypothetical protein